jgi:hypothetical protein
MPRKFKNLAENPLKRPKLTSRTYDEVVILQLGIKQIRKVLPK